MLFQTRNRRSRARDVGIGAAGLIAAGGAGAALEFFLDPQHGRRRRRQARDRTRAIGRRALRRARRRAFTARRQAVGLQHRAAAAARPSPRREYDDVTLARKVESELFRPADVPKGAISVNACDGIVQLRGAVGSLDEIVALGERAAAVAGVRRVENLLHTPGSPPKHAPPSAPDEVRARIRAAARSHDGARLGA